MKKKIQYLIFNLLEEKIKINNLFFFNSTKFQQKKLIKKNSIIIFYGKNKIKKFIFCFTYLIVNKVKFCKNCFLIFKVNNLMIGHNILPDWPGSYLSQSFIKNIKLWLKNFCYIFFYLKNLNAIILKIN